MRTLQAARVHAAVVNTVADLFEDSQLRFRRTWQAHDHPEIGRHHYRMVAYQLHDTPGRVRGPAPCLGEHNGEVFRDWLGLGADEVADADPVGAPS